MFQTEYTYICMLVCACVCVCVCVCVLCTCVYIYIYTHLDDRSKVPAKYSRMQISIYICVCVYVARQRGSSRQVCLCRYTQTNADNCVCWYEKYIHIHIYIQEYIHTGVHTYRSTYIQEYIHTGVHTYRDTYIHTHITHIQNTHMRTYIHTYIHIFTDGSTGSLEQNSPCWRPWRTCLASPGESFRDMNKWFATKSVAKVLWSVCVVSLVSPWNSLSCSVRVYVNGWKMNLLLWNHIPYICYESHTYACTRVQTRTYIT